MKDNWHNEGFAKRWNDENNIGNPTRSQVIELLTRIVSAVYRPGTKLLDLGFGSGQIEESLYSAIPELDFVGVDSSEAMINLAKEHLEQHDFKTVTHDLAKISELDLGEKFSVALSVQALHELTDKQKQSVINFVYGALSGGGYYLIADRFLIPGELDEAYKPVWEFLEENTGVKSGKNFSQYAKTMRSKEDHTTSAEQHIAWLEAAGFAAAVIYLNMDRGIIVARK